MAKDNSRKKGKDGGTLRQVGNFFRYPSSRYSVGFITVTSVIFGIMLWGGFNWSLEVTNTEAFCISCHEMENYVYQEYKDTIHYNNRTGVRATCPDCHVPKEWAYKMVRKVRASDSRECRNCHDFDSMDYFEQERRGVEAHITGNDEGQTCIHCHQGIAHSLPALYDQDPGSNFSNREGS
jgi:cytochrome c-type protein NapC